MKTIALWLAGLSVLSCQRWDQPLSALSNPDPEARAAAVRQVAKIGAPEDVASLILRADDPDPEVRGAIADAMADLDSRPSTEALAALVADESVAVQLRAVTALSRSKNPHAHAYLLLAYQRDGAAVRARVAELLRASGGSPSEAVAAEAEALFARYSRELASTGAERLIAAEKLGSSGRPEAVDRLTRYLGAESHALAAAAARGLGASGAAAARGPLEALLTEDDPNLRLAGAEALGELADPQAADALSRAIQADNQEAPSALRSLIRLVKNEPSGSPDTPSRAATALCQAVGGTDAALTVAAATAIRELGRSCEPEPLRARLLRRDPGPTLAAIAVLWETEPSKPSRAGTAFDRNRLASAVGSLLRNGSAPVRPFAARAAGALGLASLEPDLERARKEAGLEVQTARERWIRSPPPDQAAAGPSDPASLPSLFSPEPAWALSLWAEATAAEIRLGSLEVRDQIDRLAHDPSPLVREQAAGLVSCLAPASQWRTLGPLLDDPNPMVRGAALAQLQRIDVHPSEAVGWLLAQLGERNPEAGVVPLVAALSRLRELPGVERALIAELDRPDGAPAAAHALATIPDREVRSAILDHLRDPFAVALPELLQAVATRERPDPGVVEACRRLLFHPQPEVRAAAARALLAFGDPTEVSQLLPLRVDYDLRVRRAATPR